MKCVRKSEAFDRQGFTLIEILIVIAIIAILAAFVIISFRGQINRANDAKRKSDLYNLKIAIEEYNNDHDAFPPEDIVASCGGNGLSPYLKEVPCDPVKRSPYGYILSPSSGGYRVCTILEDVTDTAIETIGCGGVKKCGLEGGWNYCLSTGTTASAVGTADETIIVTEESVSPTSTPTPVLTPPGPGYGCMPDGQCRAMDDPSEFGCRVTFPNGADCLEQCSFNPDIVCTLTGL